MGFAFFTPLAGMPRAAETKTDQHEIRVLFCACFGRVIEDKHACPRVPFFGSFLGKQERTERFCHV